jgi:hypothetical protein
VHNETERIDADVSGLVGIGYGTFAAARNDVSNHPASA